MKTVLIILGIIIGVIGLIFLILVIGVYKRSPKFNNKGFTILERRLLEVFTSMCDLEMADKLKKQINYFEDKRKWRQYWDKSMSIELYGDQDLAEDQKYPRRDESKIATIRFKVNDEKYSIEFDSYDGRIWGWKIRPNPKQIQKIDTIEVTSKRINNDPNEKVEIRIEKTESKPIPEFFGVIEEIVKLKQIEIAYKPLTPEQIEIFKHKIDSRLPDGYLNIIKQTEGLEFKDFQILGISEIQRTRLDDGNYFHLVEFDDGMISIKENDKNGELYFCHYSGGSIDKLGTDFNKELINRI